MNDNRLYEKLAIPSEVVSKLTKYGSIRDISISEKIINKIIYRSQWDEGIKELQHLLGDDPDGIKILWELLNLIGSYSYEEYHKRSIPENVFVDTMKICTRFLNDHFKTFGKYQFIWAWWLPREISLNEFRIGALEYEFVDGADREIAVHIPSDADLCKTSVDNSVRAFREFAKVYFPEWEQVKLVCESWMLMPELKEMLGKDSTILAFQERFEIDSVDREAMWYMGWIYPGFETIDENLPEGTSLQRNMKKFLLSGGKFGIAKGHMKNDFFSDPENFPYRAASDKNKPNFG